MQICTLLICSSLKLLKLGSWEKQKKTYYQGSKNQAVEKHELIY